MQNGVVDNTDVVSTHINCFEVYICRDLSVLDLSVGLPVGVRSSEVVKEFQCIKVLNKLLRSSRLFFYLVILVGS